MVSKSRVSSKGSGARARSRLETKDDPRAYTSLKQKQDREINTWYEIPLKSVQFNKNNTETPFLLHRSISLGERTTRDLRCYFNHNKILCYWSRRGTEDIFSVIYRRLRTYVRTYYCKYSRSTILLVIDTYSMYSYELRVHSSR